MNISSFRHYQVWFNWADILNIEISDIGMGICWQ